MATPSRRRVLQWLGAAGALGATGAFLSLEPDTGGRPGVALPEGEFLGTPVAPLAGIETPSVTIGFVPITCATTMVLAAPLNFYAKHGLRVSLRRFGGWAEIRDAFIAGEIDGAHLLSPIPLAVNEGYGTAQVDCRLAVMGNVNGQAVTVSRRHPGVAGPQDLRGMTLAVPFAYSMHNLLLRHYLSTGGLDPDRDVRIQIVRPPDMVAQLLSGNIDGYLSPDPFNQRAVNLGVGYIHRLTRDFWSGHPCCGLVVRGDFAEANPTTYRALLRAVSDSAAWADDPARRRDVAGIVSAENYLDQPAEVVEQVLTGVGEDGRGGTLDVPDRIGFEPFPWLSAGTWIASQLRRWDLAPGDRLRSDDELVATAARVFDPDGARDAMEAVGLAAPAENTRTERVLGSTFAIGDAARWAEREIA